MMVKNIFSMHEWGINQFLEVVLSIQILMFLILSLDYFGFQIPILRSLLGFIYLSFLPGILILRLLKIRNLSDVESLVFTVGLSLAFLMFTGALMDIIYPFFGVSTPLSFASTIVTVSSLIILLSILCWVKDDGDHKEDYINIENTNLTLLLLLIPVLTIFGTYLMNFYNKNFLTVIVLILISSISVLGLSKYFKPVLYPLTIFVVGISLLYHNALISMNIWGWDINAEYFLADLVVKNAYWNPHIYSNVNSMLSVVILAPMYSMICKLNLTWVFKVVYPFIFSMVPVGLYSVIKRYTTPKISFLSVFYFMAVYMFCCDMLQLARQEVAELFFVLLLLLMVNKKLDMLKGFALFNIFGMALVVSHYGLAYIYMFCITLTTLIVYLSGTRFWKHLPSFQGFRNKLGMLNSKFTICFLGIFIVTCISWYAFTSYSSNLYTIEGVFYKVFIEGFGSILNPNTAQGLSIASSVEPLFFHQVTKILFLISQTLIFLGLVAALFSKSGKFGTEYLTFSVLSFLIAGCGLVLPYFAISLQTSRFYQITLLVLSPFFVIGAISIFDLVSRVIKVKFEGDSVLKATALFLSLFLLFNVGVVYEFADEIEPSMSLIALNNFDYPLSNSQESYSAEWLSAHDKNNANIYVDYYRRVTLTKYFGDNDLTPFEENQELSRQSLIYLGTNNIKEDQIALKDYNSNAYGDITYFKLQDLSQYNRIYVDDGSEVYLNF